MTKKEKKGRITVDREVCKGCYLCISVCPTQSIGISGELNQKGYYPAEFPNGSASGGENRCTGCTTCAIVCPDVAIEVYRE